MISADYLAHFQCTRTDQCSSAIPNQISSIFVTGLAFSLRMGDLFLGCKLRLYDAPFRDGRKP